MGKIVEKKKKKKKGRPSLLDLQKRNLREQQNLKEQPQRQTKRLNNDEDSNNNNTQNSSLNYKTATPTITSLRRSTRRHPISSPDMPLQDENDDELNGKRREKKLKLVLKVPHSNNDDDNKSPIHSASEDDDAASNHKKRKINAIADGSTDKGDNNVSGSNPTNNVQGGTLLASGPSTPLPDKKLLFFILDRLQKKDTYGVFSEPVDPGELPDYHEVIEHPMDFGTVRKKLTTGAYADLEMFEKDVFLICSNAMQYNAPETVYFRQARSIHELAKKSFENLRQDSDDNEPEPKIVRRGRPPTKFKKSMGRPSVERTGSESDATPATVVESSNLSSYDIRKGLVADKSGFADSSGRFHGPRNDAYTSWLAENKYDRNDEATGSTFKGSSLRHGKKQSVLDESRRNTYKQSLLSCSGRELSVLTTFDGERKQLMAVGLFSEYGYARSLARFAANLGPLAWKIASKRIGRCLPAGVKFGPGWVGENDIPPQRPLFPLSYFDPEGNKSLEKLEEDNSSEKHIPIIHSTSRGNSSNPLPASTSNSSSHWVATTSCEPIAQKAEGMSSHSGFNSVSSSAGAISQKPSFRIRPGMNVLNGTSGFTLPAQMVKLMGTASGLSYRSPQMFDAVSKADTNFVQPASPNNSKSEDPEVSKQSGRRNDSPSLTPRSRLNSQSFWKGLSQQQIPDSVSSPQQKSDSVPPDLNVQFQSPGSPNSSRVDSAQPDLALQL